MLGKIVLAVIGTVATAVLVQFYYNNFSDLEPPKLPEYFWGPKNSQKNHDDTTVKPFKIQIEENSLKNLYSRLEYEESQSKLLPPLEGIGFEYGFNSIFLKKVVTFWRTKYDWRAREKLLNKYPHFKTKINGIEIHFQHIKNSNTVGTKKYKFTRPLLILHGWPGSFVEFQKAIPMLLQPENSEINFELIIPSLPGFGFSERAHKPGLGPIQITQIFLNLMKRLGYEKFYVQGGDWGSSIGTEMAAIYPENVVALHINMCMSSHPRTYLRQLYLYLFPQLFLTDKEDLNQHFSLGTALTDLLHESGYMHLQSTKPDTIGVALSNSPTGLVTYMLEKFSVWTNLTWREKENGGLDHFNLEELLDNVMIYWFTNSITSSMRLYADGMTKNYFIGSDIHRVPVKVPSACMSAPNELFNIHYPHLLQDKFHNLISFTRTSAGGHFAAFEVPDIFTKDVIQFFNLVEPSTRVAFDSAKTK